MSLEEKLIILKENAVVSVTANISVGFSDGE